MGGFSFVAGVWLSDIVLVIISNAFTALVTDLMEYKNVIGYIGSVFLIGVGFYYLFFKKVSLRAEGEGISIRKRDVIKIFSSGFFLNTLNPSVFIFWLGSATAFAKFTFNERMIGFAVCLLFNMAADVLKVMLAGKLRNRLTLHNISLINKLSGVILAGFGVALFYGTYFLSDKLN
jgi:Putative threonine efflux protein